MHASDKAPPDPHRTFSIALVSVEPAVHAALLSIEPFRAANRLSQSPLFQIDFLSARDDERPPMDITLPATASLDDDKAYDLVLLHSSYEFGGDRKSALFRWLRRQAASRAQICALDAAPLLLAEAGLLKGYRATSHWSTIASFRELHPETDVVEQLFVVDRDRSTCAGQLASLDLSLFMLERFCGAALKTLVANEIVYPVARADHSLQREIVNSTTWQANPFLARAQRLMQETIEEPLSIEELAGRCGISARELQYLFRKYLKASPKSYYLTFRLQRAKELLLYSPMSVGETGLACGFSSPGTYFRAFRARYKTSPTSYRRAFRENGPRPDGRRLY
ncbi:helix-turn-helix domain-containing protein [Rhizobium sp. LjRoot30]|uniref:GlxA family transcriptional regulator n=1 Tax=Rhizobium sp. LjRoot30 TaxID=3342320 RepID=UPI003ED16E2F